MSKKIAVITLGCSKNQVDSEVMCGLLEQGHQIIDDPSEADIIIVNTCTFIEEAKNESIASILEMAQYKDRGNCERLIVTGCMAQRYSQELLQEIPEIDALMGTGEVPKIAQVVNDTTPRQQANPLLTNYIFDEKLPRKQLSPQHLAYVKIAEGCDNHCTFCVIPQVRGRFRSRSLESIRNEAEALVKNGVREILLIAQDSTRYGLDLYGEQKLPELIRLLAGISDLKWIRLMYCYPDSFSDELIETMRNEKKVCKYIDLPLQHADDRILREMNRRGTAEDARRLIEKLRLAMPDIVIRSTLITGFPGETEHDFETLISFIQDVEFDRLGIFPYSQEEKTPAGQRTDQIPKDIREDRKDVLMKLQHSIALNRQQRWIGRNIEVILDEKLPDGRWLGRSQGDAPEIDGQVYVNTKDQPAVPGEIITVDIDEADSYDLLGTLIDI